MILCVVVVCLPFFVVVRGFLYATTQDELGKYFHYVSHFFLQLQQWTCLGKKLLSSKPLWIMWNKQAEWHFELLLCCFWSTAIFLTCLEWLGMWLWKKKQFFSFWKTNFMILYIRLHNTFIGTTECQSDNPKALTKFIW